MAAVKGTFAEKLDRSLESVVANQNFTEAIVRMNDASRLCFRHAVGERWAKSVGRTGQETEGGLAAEILAEITTFRLNAKHLDIQFCDESRWDNPIPGLSTSTDSSNGDEEA